jgi:arsenate reductase
MIYEQLQKYCETLQEEFDRIPLKRKQILEQIAVYITNKTRADKPVQLMYICTHNSRRSHLGQIWAMVARVYYNNRHIQAFSGGTEVTAFHINAIQALRRAGLDVRILTAGTNPVYEVVFGSTEEPIVCFSKAYDDQQDLKEEFAAIMMCSDAEENCPFISGAGFRAATTYDDPKAADNTVMQDAIYDERCRQIAREVFYTFSKLNSTADE